MKALIVSLESFQKGEVPPEVIEYIQRNRQRAPFIILDESSKIKTNEPCKESKKSKRTQAVLKLNKIGERCILTGTFMSMSPVNAYDQMNFLKEGFFPEGMYAFAERYVIRRSLKNVRGARTTISKDDYMAIYKRLSKAKDNPDYSLRGLMDGVISFYGLTEDSCKWIYDHPEYTPFKHLDELWERIGDVCVHPKKSDILDIPPKNYKTYKIELTSEQKKLYLQLQNQNCTDNIVVDNGLKLYLRFQDICNGYEPIDGGEVIGNDGKVHHVVKLRPLAVNPKLDLLDEIVESFGQEQVVIWCSRSVLLHDACARLRDKGYTCGIYDGKVSASDRERDYNDFFAKKLQVIFVNQSSGGYGLDKLRNANYAIYLCNDSSVEKRQQSEDRIDRGQHEESKYIIDLTCTGTVEQRVTEGLLIGQELINSGTTDASIFKYYGE